MFFRKKQKIQRNYAPLESAEEAKPLAGNVPRSLTMGQREYTVVDEVVYQSCLYLICFHQGKIAILASEGRDESCTAVDDAQAKVIYAYYINQPK